MKTQLPPWLEPAWQQLLRSRQQGRLPHAVLLTGPDGVAKHWLAERFATLLLCHQPSQDGEACGECPSCNWLAAGSHPDLTELGPEESGKAIKIDQVRALAVELGMTSHGGRYKVAVIDPADAMNINAANSLLKTLEEPTPGTLLILVTASPGRLPATVRSRCQQLRLHAPAERTALDWLEARGVDPETGRRCLQVAGGAPLAAAQLADSGMLAVRDQRLKELAAVFRGGQDPLRLAAEWQGEHEARTLSWWQGWLRSLVRWQQAGLPPAEPQVAQTLQQISESVDCRQLYELSDRLSAALNSLGSGLNRQLLLEDLLIDWAGLAGRPSAPGTATRSTKKTL
jgi:DNA polymerase-3 subunit delta'